MTTLELKSRLLQKISEVEDPVFFEALKLFIDLKLEQKIYTTSEGQKSVVEEGLNQLRKGEGISDDDVDMKIQGWLNGK